VNSIDRTAKLKHDLAAIAAAKQEALERRKKQTKRRSK